MSPTVASTSTSPASFRTCGGTRISGTEFDGKDRIWIGSLQGRSTLRAVRKP